MPEKKSQPDAPKRITWGPRTERALDRMVREFTIEEWRADARAKYKERWMTQYIPLREAYLETLPELSRMGRMIWIHARRRSQVNQSLKP